MFECVSRVRDSDREEDSRVAAERKLGSEMRTDEPDYEAVCHQQATAYHPTLYLVGHIGNLRNLHNLEQADPDFD